MTRKEISKEVHQQLKELGLSTNYENSKDITDVVINTIISNIADGKTVAICELGTFQSNLRTVLDPRDVKITSQKWIISFSTSWSLKKRINEKFTK